MTTERDSDGGWRVTAGFVGIVVLAGGWFLLSSAVMHTAAVDALGEAAGVAFALLVVASVIGAVLGSRRGGTSAERGGGPDQPATLD